MFCEKCGTQNEDGNLYCTSCNQPLTNPQNVNNQTAYTPSNNPPMGQPPYVQQPNPEEHVSVGQWVGIVCLNLIPCVGSIVYLVMMFVWAFGNTPKKSLKTYAKAQLIILAVSIAIAVIFVIVTAILGWSLFNNSYYNDYWYY